jgi:hypothetical protein
LGFWLGTTKWNQEAAFQVLPGSHQSAFFLGGGGGPEFRVFHLCNTRWFQVLETKIPATKEPLGSGYLKKFWNQRIAGFQERTGQKIVGFHERTEKGLAGNLKQVVVFFFPSFFRKK